MSKVYQQEILNGVPVYIKDERVYTWERDTKDGREPIEIGTFNADKQAEFILDADWREKTEERMLEWREKQEIRSRTKLRNT